MVEIIEVNSLEELASYRLLWNSLLPGTRRATFFHTFDWLNIYWQHFGDGQKLRVVVLRASGKPVGILPLAVRRERQPLGTARVLGYPLDGWGNWYGPIGPNQAATMLASLQHLRRTTRDWDMIELRGIGPQPGSGGRPDRAMRVAGWNTDKRPDRSVSVVNLTGRWQDYLATRSDTMRHELEDVARHTSKDGRLRYIRYRPRPAVEGEGDPRWDLFDMCWQVADANRQTPSPNSKVRQREFLKDAHAAAARLGMVDVNLLMLDNRPAAFSYNYHFSGRVISLFSGSDCSVTGHDTSNLLWRRQIQDGMDRSDHALEFGPRCTTLENQLRTHEETSYCVHCVPLGSWRSQVLRVARWAKQKWPMREVGAR